MYGITWKRISTILKEGRASDSFLCLKKRGIPIDYIKLIEEVRAELLQVVNQRCDDMIQMYQNGDPYNRSEIRSRECLLGRIFPSILKGKRPVSVTFASGETIETPTWKKAVQTILKHCNGQPDMHERLMQLRGKVFGRQRTILGKDPAGMDVPIQIDKDLYFEAKFDTEALLTMMEKKVLGPVGYDFSGIVIQYTEKKPAISESLKSVQDEGREEAPEEEQSGGMTLS